MSIRVYTRRHCGPSRHVVELLTAKGVAFEIVDLTGDDETRERLEAETGWSTLPMIFVDDVFIGGWDDLEELEDDGELDVILGR